MATSPIINDWTFENTNPLVVMAVMYGARTHVIHGLWNTPQHKIKEVVTKITGKSPKSGRKPKSLDWFTDSPREQLASSILVMLYDKIRANTEGRAKAFVIAYDRYVQLCGANPPAVDINRWFHLWQSVIQERQDVPDPERREIAFTTCKNPYCRARMMIRSATVRSNYKCPFCSGSHYKSEKHTDYSYKRASAKAKIGLTSVGG